MSQHSLHGLYVGPHANGETGCAVPEVVGRDGGEGVVFGLTFHHGGTEHAGTPIGVPQNSATLVGEHKLIASFADHQRCQLRDERGRERDGAPLPRLRRTPLQSARLRHGPRYVHAAGGHLIHSADRMGALPLEAGWLALSTTNPQGSWRCFIGWMAITGATYPPFSHRR